MSKQWEWDAVLHKYYYKSNAGVHFSDGAYVPHPDHISKSDEAPESSPSSSTALVLASSAISKTTSETALVLAASSDTAKDLRDLPPPSEYAPQSPIRIWCNLHESWFQSTKEWEIHLEETSHETCSVYGCYWQGSRFDSETHAKAHMRASHMCTVHNLLFVGWRAHTSDHRHSRCGISGCNYNWYCEIMGAIDQYKGHLEAHHEDGDFYLPWAYYVPPQDHDSCVIM
ncbi:hypothetical protein K458DRAFT_415064 [Lentithecium fluviatile CBS 122367]|uniref:Uncharacterized protein n=1 Tax=Lentithecium fluviatile CBS 122367 TaxID=1168545 RepID=A0A6G1JCX8_9PLEO|nr:hypothetical protein K458DRAFT_415064 [Lentithecium fluviatile CBS 122367]